MGGAGICLIAGLLTAQLGDAVTLRWTHSIEKIVWEEDYQLTERGLQIIEARVRGSGAGMEPPAGSVLQNGVWRYTPNLPPQPEVRLAHTPFVPPYQFCHQEQCLTAPALLPGLPEFAELRLRGCGR